MSSNRRTLDRLRHRMRTFEPIPLEPIEEDREPLPTSRPTPPPGGWADDAGWTEHAAEHFATAGEEPQE